MAGDAQRLRILSDNPASLDLLDFALVADSVADAVRHAKEPITVGIHGPWGSGKSTVLQLVRERLAIASGTCAIVTNPWEYDDHADVKGTLIGAVLQELDQLAAGNATLRDKVVKLVKRISWSRATAAIARGALTMQWNIPALVDAFTPAPEGDEQPRSMAGFRDAFSEVVDELELDHIVLLVDDLDRCLPGAVLATLEAIKLFLAVPKMGFVIAADQTMVRDAIAAGLGEQHRSDFARDYLDKIVQVPVALPQPSLEDAEAYIAVLLCQREELDGIDELLEHIAQRRSEALIPFAGDHHGGPLTPDNLTLASQVVHGLGAADVANPRRVKRFLNALEIRQKVAARRGVDLDPAVLAKLFLFEHRFSDAFRRLVAEAPAIRKQTLRAWETWASSDDGEPAGGASPEMRDLLVSEPLLADEELDRYFTLASQLIKVRIASGVSPEIVKLSRELVSKSDLARRAAVTQASQLPSEQLLELLDLLSDSARRDVNLDHAIQSAITIAERVPAVTDRVVGLVRDLRSKLTAGHGSSLADSPQAALNELARELKDDPDTNTWAAQAISAALT